MPWQPQSIHTPGGTPMLRLISEQDAPAAYELVLGWLSPIALTAVTAYSKSSACDAGTASVKFVVSEEPTNANDSLRGAR